MSNYYPRMRKYPIGTKVQRRDHYVFIKKQTGEWQAEHRQIMEQTMGRDLEPGERVYHKSGEKADNGRDNLVVIKVNTVRYTLLKESRVLYIPQRKAVKLALAG